ncbi:ABC transporter permease [Clostridiisalibacter paucivorans]|uniref:ABC transporter permease n=1 Tax=Clostridiisalibacter paucivorans TaxID=408753 RepID=UPI00047A8367|nr:ABC transporter permease [Clostridiisalibacter paucivorans]
MRDVFLWFNKFTSIGKVSMLFIVIIILIGLFSQYMYPYPYNLPSGQSLEHPNEEHWLGTDDLGIDLLSQICFGAKLSVLIGVSASMIAGFGGGILGMISGYFGGTVDRVIMRMTDIMLVLPDLPMMILLGAFFGPSTKNIIIVLALFSWTTPARIVRSKIMAMKSENYIVAAQSYGASFTHLLVKHFVPGVLPILLVTVIKLTSKSIVAEAGLSFLGLGDPTSKSWGLILNHAINFQGIYFTDYWKWWVISPLMAIILLVLAISFISRDLERILDDKL